MDLVKATRRHEKPRRVLEGKNCNFTERKEIARVPKFRQKRRAGSEGDAKSERKRLSWGKRRTIAGGSWSRPPWGRRHHDSEKI